MIGLRYLALGGAMCVLPAFAEAAEKRVSADVTTSAGYANNPFSLVGDDTGSAFVEATVRPQLQILTERNTFTVSGVAQVQQYLQRYSTTDSYQGYLDYRGRPTEHVKTHLNASLRSAIIGSANSFLGLTVVPTQDPGSAPIDPINSGTDIALFGTRARQRTINLGGDISAAVSARDQVTASAFFVDSRYSQTASLGNLNSYHGFGGSLGYARQLSQYTQMGLQASGARYVYAASGADTNVYSLQATLSTKLNAAWSLSGAAGVSFVDRARGGARASLSGNLSLCRTGPRVTACLTALRAVLPTGVLGTQTETSVGGSYRYRLSEHGTLGFTANYINNGTPISGLTNSNEYAQGTISYDRQLRQRVRLITSARYRKLFGSGFDRASDYGGQLGLAFRLGDPR